jgi:predicted nucleotidyltransferase
MSDNTELIQTELDRLAQEEQVTVLYACESGSRAWGFESADSDYDVRFLYVHRTERYLSIRKRRDVIERMRGEKLDMVGWDLTKALHLYSKSNPPLFEWLQSPIVYRETGRLASQLRLLMPEYFSPKSCMFHYLHMARGNYREYLHGDEVWIKKYFYVLRPVLSCLWIERGMGIMPTEFSTQVEGLIDDPALRRDIAWLLEEKKRGSELDRGPRIASISDFLDEQLARLSADQQPEKPERDLSALDRLFVELLIEANGHAILGRHDFNRLQAEDE